MTGKVVWPWGMTEQDPDPASRPWVFNPHGFLVAVLENDAEAERANAALDEVGFSEEERRTYPGRQVLEDRANFLARQGPARRLVEKVTSDTETVNRFIQYAEEGRAFLWVRVPDRADANRAIRGLSTNGVLFFRYYGDSGVEDITMP